jgi:hypothetical protein
MKKSIDVWNEDVLCNWMDKASMFVSKADKPFEAIKEMHPSTIQALINVCSKIGSSIMDLFASTNMCSSKTSFTIFESKNLFDHFSPYKQHCQSLPNLGHHILVLELDMQVFTNMLEPIIEVAILELDIEHVHNFDIDFPIKKRSRKLLDNE